MFFMCGSTNSHPHTYTVSQILWRPTPTRPSGCQHVLQFPPCLLLLTLFLLRSTKLITPRFCQCFCPTIVKKADWTQKVHLQPSWFLFLTLCFVILLTDGQNSNSYFLLFFFFFYIIGIFFSSQLFKSNSWILESSSVNLKWTFLSHPPTGCCFVHVCMSFCAS